MKPFLLFGLLFALNVHAQIVQTQSGAFIEKSRISSAPDYLFSDDSTYWFAYRDGRKSICFLGLNKDISDHSLYYNEIDPERESVIGAGIENGMFWHDRWVDRRMRVYLLRYWSDQKGVHTHTDTIFQWYRHFPTQKLNRHIRYEGSNLTLHIIPEQQGFKHECSMYTFYLHERAISSDTVLLLEDKAELYEFLYAESMPDNRLRWIIKKYDIRPSDKRAFNVNYTFGWLVVGKQGVLDSRLLDRKDYFTHDPCFKFLGKDSVFVSGLYGEKDSRRVVGYFHYYGHSNASDNLLKPAFRTLPSKFWENRKKVSRPAVFFRKKRLDDYYIRKFEVNENMQSTFVLQRLYTTDGGSIAGSQLYYHFKEIMFYRLTEEGQLLWHQGLASDQVLFEPFYRFGGFGAIRDQGKFIVFKNEHRRTANHRNRRPRTLSKPRQAVVSLFTFDDNGRPVHQEVLSPDFTEKMTALPASVIYVDHGKYLMFFEDKKHWLPVYIHCKP